MGFVLHMHFIEGGKRKWTIHIIAAHRLKMMEIAGPRYGGLIQRD